MARQRVLVVGLGNTTPTCPARTSGIDVSDEPDHDALCEREQRLLLRAVEEDLDLGASMEDAVKSLRIVLAADESIRSGQVVTL